MHVRPASEACRVRHIGMACCYQLARCGLAVALPSPGLVDLALPLGPSLDGTSCHYSQTIRLSLLLSSTDISYGDNVPAPRARRSEPQINAGCGEATSRALVEGLRHCLLDTNRYVIASGAEGLMRLGPQGSSKSQSAKLAVLAKLVDKRWCPITNPASQF